MKNRKDYLTEAYKQLNGTDENGEKVYFHIPTDPTSDFVIRVKDAIQEAHSKGVINTTSADYLVMIMSKQATFTFYPKSTNYNVHLQLSPSATPSTLPQPTSLSGLLTDFVRL